MVTTKRARKPKTPKNGAAELLSALKFISLAQRNEGTPYQTHCALYDEHLIAFDGVVSTGSKVKNDLKCCPHTLKLVAALSKCGEEVELALLDSGKLAVKSGKFRALIPCVGFEDMVYSSPDEAIAPLDERFTQALALVAPLPTEGAQEVFLASVQLNGASLLASLNGAVLFEAWHGLSMPTGINLPKAAVAAVMKSGKKLAKFGLSEKSFTFYFEDESWLRTQLFDEEWPDVYEILNKETNAWPVPDGLYQAIDSILPFTELDSIYFKEKALWSHADDSVAASYEIEGLPTGPIFSGKYLKLLQGIATRIDFSSYQGMAYFFGENVRGVVMGRVV